VAATRARHADGDGDGPGGRKEAQEGKRKVSTSNVWPWSELVPLMMEDMIQRWVQSPSLPKHGEPQTPSTIQDVDSLEVAASRVAKGALAAR